MQIIKKFIFETRSYIFILYDTSDMTNPMRYSTGQGLFSFPGILNTFEIYKLVIGNIVENYYIDMLLEKLVKIIIY